MYVGDLRKATSHTFPFWIMYLNLCSFFDYVFEKFSCFDSVFGKFHWANQGIRRVKSGCVKSRCVKSVSKGQSLKGSL